VLRVYAELFSGEQIETCAATLGFPIRREPEVKGSDLLERIPNSVSWNLPHPWLFVFLLIGGGLAIVAMVGSAVSGH
jgi:hypothetical protein